MKHIASFRPRFFEVFRGYSRQTFSADLMAGLVVGIVALPLAIAFGIASGVSPEKGIITAVVAGFVVSLLGGSRVQIGGPTGAFIVIVALTSMRALPSSPRLVVIRMTPLAPFTP